MPSPVPPPATSTSVAGASAAAPPPSPEAPSLIAAPLTTPPVLPPAAPSISAAVSGHGLLLDADPSNPHRHRNGSDLLRSTLLSPAPLSSSSTPSAEVAAALQDFVVLIVRSPVHPDLHFTVAVPLSPHREPPSGCDAVAPFSSPTGVTVGDLKRLLSETYPGHPAVDSQRLIAGGKLLQDGSVVTEVFGKTALSKVVHLVAAPATPVLSAPPPPQATFFDRPSSSRAAPPPMLQSRRVLTAPPELALLVHPPSVNANRVIEQMRPLMADMVAQHILLSSGAYGHATVRVKPQVVHIGGVAYQLQLRDPVAGLVSSPHMAGTPEGSTAVRGDAGAAPPPVVAARANANANANNNNNNNNNNNALQQILGVLFPGDGGDGDVDDWNDDPEREARRPNPLWLLLKLTFGVALFSQGAGPARAAAIHFVALLIFLGQMGLLGFFARWWNPPPPRPQQQEELPEQQQQQQETPPAPAGADAPPAAPDANPVDDHGPADPPARAAEVGGGIP
ncbi:hypothetical protein HK405_006229, partial [Cladochytrium tenue]